MALVLDAGPILASLDRTEASYASCRDLIIGSDEQLIIPAPVLVEVDYWIHRRLHQGVLIAMLDDINGGFYRVEDLRAGEYSRVRELCDQYADSDIGFVDAAVLTIVERLNEPKLATLDHRHFGMMRPRHVSALTLLPD